MEITTIVYIVMLVIGFLIDKTSAKKKNNKVNVSKEEEQEIQKIRTEAYIEAMKEVAEEQGKAEAMKTIQPNKKQEESWIEKAKKLMP